jgi:hypothetical protein
MYNQRKDSRKKLMKFAPVYDLRLKTLLGYVGDLTLKGVMVIGEKPLEINKHVILGIEFPEKIADMDIMRVVITGRVARCQEEENNQYFDIGFEFIELTTEAGAIIEAVLERYQFRSVLDIADLNP